MTAVFWTLIAAATIWIVLHLVIAGSNLRWIIAARLGEGGFRIFFSLASIASLGFLIWSYARAIRPGDFYGLWVAEDWILWFSFIIMPIAILLLVGSLSLANPTLAGAEGKLKAGNHATGMMRITRHPMLWAFALWAFSHLTVNGDAASLIFFGSFLIISLAGMRNIDAKRARTKPAAWADYAHETSIIPFFAIVQGRNRLVFKEIGLYRIGTALFIWLAMLGFHKIVIGVSPFPF